MSRTRLVFTLVLVAALAMLVGLAASTFAQRRLSPGPLTTPEATKPPQPSDSHLAVYA